MIIFANDFLELLEENGKVLLKTFKSGFPLKDIDEILRQIPRVRLTNFAILKKTLENETLQPVEIGRWLPNLELEISKDKMTASLFVNETSEDFKSNQDKISTDIDQILSQNNINHGIVEIDFDKIIPGKAIVIAKGTPPIKGEDAKITYLEIPERKPVIREDGKADFFEMNFIFEIKEGDWLGEKIPPQQGIDGKNVNGEAITAPPGDDIPLKYDPQSAYEAEENGKIILYAGKTGVVENQKGVLAVNNHLPIDGDVGIETGNIKFDGSVSIKGTVNSGFSVIATGDISIEGPEGVSGAKSIKSETGDIFIKGGIFGAGETEVEAGGSIFVKHVNDANLVAKNDIIIGSYSLGSYLVANSILVDERKGKIIGGKTVAKNTIVTAISGNRLERRTELIIERLSKQETLELIQEKAALLKSIREEIVQLTAKINQISKFKERLNNQQLQSLHKLQEELEKKKTYTIEIDQEIKQLMIDVKEVGKEEIVVSKEAYPGTLIQIGNKSSVLSHITQGKFLLEFGELNV